MAQSKEQQLWQGCTDGNLGTVKELASDPAVDINWVGEDRLDTPLHRACRFGHLEIVKVLLAREKIEVNKGNKGDAGPFSLACQEGHKEVVSLLLTDPRIDLNKANKKEVTPFYVACQNGHKEVVSLLLADPRIDPNKPQNEGATPLNMACQEGHKEVVSLLLADPRVDPNEPANEGATPLNMACQEGHKEVVSLLLADPRIDPNKSNRNSTTSFFIACQEGHKEIASLLLADQRVDPNKAKNDGATPFSVACECGHKEVVLLLLADPRIDPNKPMNNYTSPLWYASQNGHLVVVQLLLASEKEINTRTRSTFNNKTAAEQGRTTGLRATKPADEPEGIFQRKKTNSPLCADLIDEYERDPEHLRVKHRLRRLPGLREYFIGHLFALVIFHSDNFVAINERTAHSDTRRFFRITSHLPLDLQMVLCNRIFGSPRDVILSRDSELGFRYLARTITWQQ